MKERSWHEVALHVVVEHRGFGCCAIFLDHVEMAAPWDFIALQEGFRVLEGLDGGGHGVFTPPELEGGLR